MTHMSVLSQNGWDGISEWGRSSRDTGLARRRLNETHQNLGRPASLWVYTVAGI